MLRIMFASMLALTLSTFASAARAPVPNKPLTVEDSLAAKDFYEQPFKVTEENAQEIATLATESKHPIVRVRASKILVDQAGNGRDQLPGLTKAAFGYLENNLKSECVKALLFEQGFTHYTTSANADGSAWFLIEHVKPMGRFNGGLNLRYDAKTKKIVEMKAWGTVDVAQKDQ